MPRTGPRRPSIALRLGTEILDKVDSRANDEGLSKGNGEPNRSELIRRMIDFSLAEMPKGWGEAPAREQLPPEHEKTTKLADALELANTLT